MNINPSCVLSVVDQFRRCNDASKFLLKGEADPKKMKANARERLMPLGYAEEEEVYAIIDNSPCEKCEEAAPCEIILTSRGVYVYVSDGAAKELEYMEPKSDFLSWEDLSKPYTKEFESNIGPSDESYAHFAENEDDPDDSWRGEFIITESICNGVPQFVVGIREVGNWSKQCVANTGRPFTLAPRKITDVQEMAKLWSYVKISDRRVGGVKAERANIDGGWSSTSGLSEIMFIKGIELKKAMYAVQLPEFSKYIKVDALAFPALYCTDRVKKEEKWYEECLFKDGEREDLIPLSDKRTGREDAWRDERFKLLDENCPGNWKARIDDDTCIWVKCKDCNGRGSRQGKVFVGRGREGRISCPKCDGSGKIGARLCPKCKGFGTIYSYDDVDQYKTGSIKCETCGGSGKMKSVLRLNHVLSKEEEKYSRFFGVPKETIPDVLLKQDKVTLSEFPDYGVISEISAHGECDTSPLIVPTGTVAKDKIVAELKSLHKELLPSRAHCLEESVSIGLCTRYVRFHLQYYVGGVCWGSVDGNGTQFYNNAAQGILPNDYFRRRRNYTCDMSMWLDLATGKMYGRFPQTKGSIEYPQESTVLLGILMKMGKAAVSLVPDSAELVRERAHNDVKSGKNNHKVMGGQEKRVSQNTASTKRRWIYICLGIFLGWMGVHFLYAKRWGLLLLHIAFVCATVAFPLCAVLCLSTWLGGTFFIKKDGSGNRMA